ncbi:TadE/TadG family type IV pilus assembly protein [Paenibacillus sp. LPE1-1-1.1]|uniref:TadE/TadG family type IV pilus assembly protein n=1 Tax=Paenibacillaceae TaxID=186822 RepID=UPI00342DF00F
MAGNEQGSQAIEFVGVLPLFLLMILIVTQFVYAGVTVVVAKQVAMEGARAAMVELTSGANYEAAVRNAAGKYKVNSLSKHEYISGSDTYVTVKVTLESPIVTGGLFRSSGISLPVSSEVTVRKEELE